MTYCLVFGIIPDINSIDTLLNNLNEAEFNIKDTSVMLTDNKKARAIHGDNGPMKDIASDGLQDKLKSLGISMQDSAEYVTELSHGKAFVAMKIPKETADTACEMLKDYNVELLKVIPG